MRLLRNFTLHRQGAHEQALAAEEEFVLETEPDGVEVAPGFAGLSLAAHLLATRLDRCAIDGAAGLIGGHTALWIVSLDLLTERSRRRPDLYYFETARRRDVDERFVFAPGSLAKVPRLSIRAESRDDTRSTSRGAGLMRFEVTFGGPPRPTTANVEGTRKTLTRSPRYGLIVSEGRRGDHERDWVPRIQPGDDWYGLDWSTIFGFQCGRW